MQVDESNETVSSGVLGKCTLHFFFMSRKEKQRLKKKDHGTKRKKEIRFSKLEAAPELHI